MSRTPGRLHASHVGDAGPRVVFLHGLFGQGKNWTSVARALGDAARITLLDLPNHGRSPWTEEFSYPDLAERVAGHLAAEGGGEPYAVVGHSMGGKVAMALALRHRELVERLCVVDVSPVSTAQLSGFAGFVEGMRALDLARLPDRAAADAALAPWVAEPGVRSFLLQNLRRGPDPHRPGSGQGWHWQMNLELLGDQLSVMGGWPELGADPYPGPVLWVAGARSGYVQPQFAPAMRALFPRTQLVTLKGAGHWVHSDQPEVFVATVRRFLHP